MSRLLKILIILLFCFVGVAVPSCAPTELPSICYQYNFAIDPSNSAGDPINVSAGAVLEGIGFQTVGGELVVSWSETFFIEWIVLEVVIARPDGVEGDISIAFVADAFGIDIEQAGTLPADSDVETIYFEHSGAAEWSKDFNAIVQSSQPIWVGSMTVYLNGANPFPRDDCAPTTPTVPATNTPTNTPEQTPTPTSTPACSSTNYPHNHAAWSGGSLNASCSGQVRHTGANGTPDPHLYYLTLTLPEPVYVTNFSLTVSGSTRIQSDFPVSFYYEGGLALDYTTQFPGPTACTHGLSTTDFPGVWTDEIRVNCVPDSNIPRCIVQIKSMTLITCLDEEITPTISNTPTPTPTSTPLGIGSSTPTKTGIQPATRTATITLTPSNTGSPLPPSITPIPPTANPSWTPPPSVTPMDTPTGIPLPTEVEGTVTPWGTYPGADLTPLPGTPVFGDVSTPIVGTLAGTPTVIKTPLEVPDDLEDTHPDIEQGLGTAVAYVNLLPDDFSIMYPRLGNIESAAGYARWLVSGASCQEIFGQRLCPIPLHIAYGFFVMIFVSTVMIIFRFALWFFRFVIWAIRFILKIIPFIG